MCSIDDCACEIVDDRPVIRRNGTSSVADETQRICKKCRTEDVKVTLKATDGGYCESCFLKRTSHKFRATLGKSKIIRKDDSVLVFHDGSANSTALLHLIKSAQNESAQKKLLMEPIVLYIDEITPESRSMQQRRLFMESAIEQVRKLGFAAYTTSLASFPAETVPLHAVNDDWQPNPVDPSEAMSETLSSLTDRSAKEDLILSLRRQVLVTAARQLGCNKVLLSDTSRDIAVKLLTNLVLGRGAQLSFYVNFADARYSDVLFLRPMKDFSREEVEHYLSHCDLPSVDFHNADEEPKVATDSTTSLQDLTRSFVDKLDSEFGGTVSTVFRTGEKLCGEAKGEDGKMRDACRLCNATLDADSTASSNDDKLFAIRATDFSKLVSSTLRMNCNHDDNGDSGVFDGDDGSPTPAEESEKSLQRMLCYGCRLILCNSNDRFDASLLIPHLKR